MTTNEPHDAVERLFDRTLHELPLRRAPLTLESRVLCELQRRAALPWWRRSFAHWPLIARAAFLVICCALIRLAFLGTTTAVAEVRSLHESGALSLSWAREIGAIMASVGNLALLLARTVPPIWLYEGITAFAVLYAVLFGLGATVYRMLYLQPQNGRRLNP
jgi:hypothetical protein